jgi:ferredoxin-type protein NapG
MSDSDTHKGLASRARRRFLSEVVAAAGGVALLGMGLGLYSRQVSSLPAQAIRPPGAGSESDFLSACVRCGLCVRDCPYDTLKLAQVGEAVAVGTPWFEARGVPCEMCEDIPCVKACPTGALDPELTDIDDARMGLAVVVDKETCIAFRGLRCEVCFNVCPVRGKAITLEMQHNIRSGKHAMFIPVVHSSDCTGCGKCEHACILEEAAIKVFSVQLAKGKIGEHYRLGWEEKGRAGESLVAPDREHQYNLPEGMRYDYEGEGLIQEGDTPFSSDPLETLRRGQEGL